MDPICHRCGNSLAEEETFCRHCGAPQLVVEAADPAVPQQPAVRLRGNAHAVDWRAAILAALLVALPVGLLSALTKSSSLFPIGGGFAAIALYRRRAAAFTDGRIGWRVGSILGAASAFVACAAWGAQLMIERYLLHQGAAIDQLFRLAAQQEVDAMMHASAAQGPQPPEMVHALHNLMAFWVSPDGIAGAQISTAIVMSLAMVLFAATGGAIAGRILAVRTRVQRSL
ncbi:MAG TPA: zinc ribbon domain-containing protein [Acidobacteriaceae bacterium]